ncbi:MAG: SIS domain-containing protein [Micropruina sp.]|uniref:SIS domain-containing protein n=1 Tax=Micropruina sp. TaxID=2737536 RepID=UPI0039E5A775
MFDFDDSRLENPDVLAAASPLLINLASSGARVRRETATAETPLAALDDSDRPRAVIAYGPEARLLRAVLEPVCPVPFVAWPALGLPGWVGPLDVVLLIGRRGPQSLAVAHEAVRRGCRLIVACPTDSPLAEQAASRSTTLLPVNTGDPLAAAVVCLVALHRLGLGPYINSDTIASAMDAVAERCAARTDVSVNPAKTMALDLADAVPLVWGGSVLAARASRRIVEALRQASGRVGLSADASELLPLIQQVQPRDPFADPFEEGNQERRPGLVLIDDGQDDAAAAEFRVRLERTAQAVDLRLTRLEHFEDTAVERYVTVLLTGLFGAAYLQIGLGRTAP